MICFNDMTYCSFFEWCKNGKRCFRALTKKVKDNAMRADMGIAVFVDKPDCFEEKNNETN